MAGKSVITSNDILKLIYQAVAISNLADNTATSPITNIYVALHTADPTDSGTQESSEATYTGYARVGVVRTSSGWAIDEVNSEISPVAAIDFPTATAGTETITHFSTGYNASGASEILHSGTVTPNISVSSGVTPQLTTDTTISES